MHYDNFIKRFVLRKNFFKRAKRRINALKRKNSKNEFDDFQFLFSMVGYQPKVIFDCGANIGFVSFQLNKKFPKSNIYSFEPNPDIFKRLDNQFKNARNISCMNIGIGSTTGELVFNLNKNTGTSSFLNPTEYHKSNLSTSKITPINVQVKSIDQILIEEKIDKIDILKLDIEGFEIEALKGIKNLKNKVSIVFAEVNIIPTYSDQPLIEDVLYYLRNEGFHFYNFYGINENKRRQANITNVLFISDNFRNELIANGHEKYFNY